MSLHQRSMHKALRKRSPYAVHRRNRYKRMCYWCYRILAKDGTRYLCSKRKDRSVTPFMRLHCESSYENTQRISGQYVAITRKSIKKAQEKLYDKLGKFSLN